MKLNADLTKRALVLSESLPWVDSPVVGVQRRMLERDGDEMATRATTIVRYCANRSFTEHIHDLGEEFFVLEGVFSDETGDYGEGMYVRNPPGSRHRPFTRDGCIIFVKLRQFGLDDANTVRIDTHRTAWLPTDIDGQWVMPLYQSDGAKPEHVALVKWSPDLVLPAHEHPCGEEIFVISGEFGDEQGLYPAGTWLRNPAGSAHAAFTRSGVGCVLYVKSGHLSQ
ncbi:MAG TPA: cupin [Porticoccaceae bacterium]|nr:cupin [Porticoccaceae bacterium]